MTTTEKIQQLRKRYEISFLASELGLHRSNLFRKIKGTSSFTKLEVEKIDRLYSVL